MFYFQATSFYQVVHSMYIIFISQFLVEINNANRTMRRLQFHDQSQYPFLGPIIQNFVDPVAKNSILLIMEKRKFLIVQYTKLRKRLTFDFFLNKFPFLLVFSIFRGTSMKTRSIHMPFYVIYAFLFLHIYNFVSYLFILLRDVLLQTACVILVTGTGFEPTTTQFVNKFSQATIQPNCQFFKIIIIIIIVIIQINKLCCEYLSVYVLYMYYMFLSCHIRALE